MLRAEDRTEGQAALPDGAVQEGPAGALADLLAREAALLRAGAFDGLEALATEKAALVEALAIADVPPPDAATRSLQAAAQRNAILLQAARDGLAAASRRLAELSAAPTGLQVYDGAGRRAKLDGAAPRNSRRS